MFFWVYTCFLGQRAFHETLTLAPRRLAAEGSGRNDSVTPGNPTLELQTSVSAPQAHGTWRGGHTGQK